MPKGNVVLSTIKVFNLKALLKPNVPRCTLYVEAVEFVERRTEASCAMCAE